MQHLPETGEKWTILPNTTFWAFQDNADTNTAYSRNKILEIQTCLHAGISGKYSMNKKYFSHKKKWKQILDKKFQFHRATVKKKTTRSWKTAIFTFQQKKQGCGKLFFLALFYIQKDQSMAKSFCGLRHCREQAHPVQWKAEELCQEATAISGCHWWAGDLQGIGILLPSAPVGTLGKQPFPGAQRDRGIPLGYSTRAIGPLALCWKHMQPSFS